MGVLEQPQSSLFHFDVNLDKRIRSNHPLRKVNELIDFHFVYDEVKSFYGHNGNESVPPPVILKMMLLLIFYNVRSERELMETIPERMDWLWFLGYDLDSTIPNHSVLSKARRKWGVDVFQSFFERIVLQCVHAGLVDGSKIFVDSSLIDANASNNSVIDTKSLKHQLHRNYKKLEARLADRNESTDASRNCEKKNSRYISSTDPDAAIVNRGKPKLSYQVHRAVDEKSEVITATDAAAGDINEAHLMLPLLDQHQATTGLKAETVVADSKYGTIENFLACHDRNIQAHIPDLRQAALKRTQIRSIFTDDQFFMIRKAIGTFARLETCLSVSHCIYVERAVTMGHPRKSARPASCASNVPRTNQGVRSSVICDNQNWPRCVKKAVQRSQNAT